MACSNLCSRNFPVSPAGADAAEADAVCAGKGKRENASKKRRERKPALVRQKQLTRRNPPAGIANCKNNWGLPEEKYTWAASVPSTRVPSLTVDRLANLAPRLTNPGVARIIVLHANSCLWGIANEDQHYAQAGLWPAARGQDSCG